MSTQRHPSVVLHGSVNDSQFLQLPVGDNGAHDWQKEMDGVQLMLGEVEAEGRFVVRVPDLVQVARGCVWRRAAAPTKSLDLGDVISPALWEVPHETRTVTREFLTCTVADARKVLAAARDAKLDTLRGPVASDAVLDAIVAALVAQGKAICASKEEQFRTSIVLLQGSLERQSSPDEASLNETRELVMCLVHGLRFLAVCSAGT
jgi:hypothetical protein